MMSGGEGYEKKRVTPGLLPVCETNFQDELPTSCFGVSTVQRPQEALRRSRFFSVLLSSDQFSFYTFRGHVEVMTLASVT